MQTKIKRALLSVFNKDGIVAFAQGLVALGYEIISTGGTAKALREGGVAVTDVSTVTGFPECFDGRVKTLHPKIHGGLLYRSNNQQDVVEAGCHGIERINLLVVDLYPFQEAAAKPGATPDQVIEMIDIGGPAMLRAAAKNCLDEDGVVVVCDPADREAVLQELEQPGNVSREHRLALAQKVFALMAGYDGDIDKWFSAQTGRMSKHLHLTNGQQLAYGENLCQNPAFLFSGGGNHPLALTNFQVVAGNPSYIAMADASRLVDVLCLLTESLRHCFDGRVPFIAIAGKHGNPCGAAVDWQSPRTALNKALRGDDVAIMGGELIANFPINDELGSFVHKVDGPPIGREFWGLDEVLAPAISSATVELLGKKAKRRLLVNPALADPPFLTDGRVYRQLYGGGWLEQRPSAFVLCPAMIQFWVGEPLADDDLASLLIAFACCWRATSNTVALAKDLQLISLGCGQQDRIACVRLCRDRANQAEHETAGSVFASDAFFPFATNPGAEEHRLRQPVVCNALVNDLGKEVGDRQRFERLEQLVAMFRRLDRREGPELLADAGCIGGVVPADGKNLEEVKEFFRQADMRVAFVAKENRGFAQH